MLFQLLVIMWKRNKKLLDFVFAIKKKIVKACFTVIHIPDNLWLKI